MDWDYLENRGETTPLYTWRRGFSTWYAYIRHNLVELFHSSETETDQQDEDRSSTSLQSDWLFSPYIILIYTNQENQRALISRIFQATSFSITPFISWINILLDDPLPEFKCLAITESVKEKKSRRGRHSWLRRGLWILMQPDLYWNFASSFIFFWLLTLTKLTDSVGDDECNACVMSPQCSIGALCLKGLNRYSKPQESLIGRNRQESTTIIHI